MTKVTLHVPSLKLVVGRAVRWIVRGARPSNPRATGSENSLRPDGWSIGAAVVVVDSRYSILSTVRTAGQNALKQQRMLFLCFIWSGGSF